jgi:hypothetical protein
MPDASDEICGAPDRIDRATDGGVRLVQLRYLDSDRAAAAPQPPHTGGRIRRSGRRTRVYLENPQSDKDGDEATLFLDADGSVTGSADARVTSNMPTSACL